MLSQHILAPRAFARLRCHVVLALRSKYAVTLYEILEAYVNRRESSLTVSLEEFRSWLKVPEDAYKDWKDLKRNVVLPAVDEINQHGEEGGFFVSYEGVREGKSYAQIRFTLAKSAERDDRDMKLQGKAKRGRVFTGSAGGQPRRRAMNRQTPFSTSCARSRRGGTGRRWWLATASGAKARLRPTIRTAHSSAGRSGSRRTKPRWRCRRYLRGGRANETLRTATKQSDALARRGAQGASASFRCASPPLGIKPNRAGRARRGCRFPRIPAPAYSADDGSR